MLKKINRVLGLLGLKLIRPRRYAPKSEAQRVKEFLEEFNGPKVPLSDYMGECEWQNTPPVPNPGKTHYVGDDCPGGHRDLVGADDHEITRVEQEANKLVEKCCGLDSHPYRVDEIPRVEQPNSDNKVSGPTS